MGQNVQTIVSCIILHNFSHIVVLRLFYFCFIFCFLPFNFGTYPGWIVIGYLCSFYILVVQAGDSISQQALQGEEYVVLFLSANDGPPYSTSSEKRELCFIGMLGWKSCARLNLTISFVSQKWSLLHEGFVLLTASLVYVSLHSKLSRADMYMKISD